MPQEPKKRHSRARQGKRRAAIHLVSTKGVKCTNCGTLTIQHAVCVSCGYYAGKQIIVKKAQAAK